MSGLAAPELTTKADGATNELCGLLLEIVGKNAGRMQTARKHVQVLNAAIPHMTLAQRTEARRRIQQLESKWGPQLAGGAEINGKGPEDCEFSPERRAARWLSTRRSPTRLLEIIYAAATAVSAGCTNLSLIMEHAYANEVDRLVHLVGYDSFREWLIELRIAERNGKAVYVPGDLCSWWVENMEPTNAKSTSYHACLKLLVELHRETRKS